MRGHFIIAHPCLFLVENILRLAEHLYDIRYLFAYFLNKI